ncbi:hypothetical protein JJC00_07045 [Bradyrhizobium diazoefficiens]|uniref:hypothetical protein n=1 Tax=Bradyrhizobium diazoefficiens TaxID=1355477 RepID=UPI00190C825F|nr:hypothetical protein [Bradyrhizobium diazoefficiens]QQO35410.1 hypothetical protein JJC00_07045 [Bradyrhizobium diazoefficiens]
MQARTFRYACGLSVLMTHVVAIGCIAVATRFTDFRDQIGSILIVAPVTLIYASSFLKYVVANTAPAPAGAFERLDVLAALTMYLVVAIFCLSLLYIVARFAFFSSYQVNEFKMWLGASETAFGALIGVVFDRLFGVQSAAIKSGGEISDGLTVQHTSGRSVEPLGSVGIERANDKR